MVNYGGDLTVEESPSLKTDKTSNVIGLSGLIMVPVSPTSYKQLFLLTSLLRPNPELLGSHS